MYREEHGEFQVIWSVVCDIIYKCVYTIKHKTTLFRRNYVMDTLKWAS